MDHVELGWKITATQKSVMEEKEASRVRSSWGIQGEFITFE